MSTADGAGVVTTAVDVDSFASPLWSRSRTGGGRVAGMGLREETAVATPPPTTAPTAKQATCMKDALGMVVLLHNRVNYR